MESHLWCPDNSVNGASPEKGGVALGREGIKKCGTEAFPVVTLRNPRQCLKMKLKDKLTVGEWNVRTLYQTGKLQMVQMEMARLGVDILGISETRWPNNAHVGIDGYSFVYSGGENHSRGVGVMFSPRLKRCFIGFWPVSERVMLVKFAARPFDLVVVQVYAPTSECSEEILEAFYSDLDKALKEVKSRDYLIILGDFNAKIGEGRDGSSVGPFGLGDRNERGDRLLEFAEEHRLTITNTWFQHHPSKLYTWISPQDGESLVRNQIDYILVKQRYKRSILNVKTYPGADCDSDHVPVIAKIKLKLKVLKKKEQDNPKWNLELLGRDELAEKYRIRTENRFEALNKGQMEDVNSGWEQIKDIGNFGRGNRGIRSY